MSERSMEPLDLTPSFEQMLKDSDALLGAATRELARLKEQEAKRDSWLWQAKEQAGYDHNVIFDHVWVAALQALKAQRADAPTSGYVFYGPDGEWHWSATYEANPECTDQRPATTLEKALLRERAAHEAFRVRAKSALDKAHPWLVINDDDRSTDAMREVEAVLSELD